MATILRPVKEGSVRTYQAKVGLGFIDILASEMDADLDTIYAAWNGGVSTVDLGDGSVTYAKLAPDAQLWSDSGTALVLGPNFTGRSVALAPTGTNYNPLVFGSRTVKGRLMVSPSSDMADLTVNASMNAAGSAYVQDDPAKASWIADLTTTVDAFRVIRLAPGGAISVLLTLDNTGRMQVKHWAGGVTGAGQAVTSGATVELSLPNVNYDTGGATSNSRVWSAGYLSAFAINLFVSVNQVAGLGWSVKIEQWTGSSWFTVALVATTNQTNLSTSVIWPSAATTQYRASITNATGASQTVTQAFLFSGTFGALL